MILSYSSILFEDGVQTILSFSRQLELHPIVFKKNWSGINQPLSDPYMKIRWLTDVSSLN